MSDKKISDVNTIKLFGKDYMPVVGRINQLSEETEGNYSIATQYDTTHYPVIIVSALLTIGENTFTGHAMGDLSDDSLRKKVKGKVLEATETHAIGRALASSARNGGEFASADEMIQNSDNNYNEQKDISTEASPKQMNYIKKLCAEKNVDEDEYVIEGMSKEDASESIETLINMKSTEVPF